MDAIFEEFETYSSSKQATYYEMMEGAMDSDESLEGLAKNLSFLLSDDQIAKLEAKGYTLSKVQNNILKLKTWSRDDRMALVDAFRAEDQDALMALNRANARSTLEAPADLVEEPVIDLTQAQAFAFEHGLRHLAIEPLADQPVFDDLIDHWSKDEVEALSSLGIINGKRKGAFYPEDYISRIEILAMVTRIAVYDDSKLAEGQIQCDPSLWYYKPLKRAKRLDLESDERESFLMALATRQEVVKYIMDAYAAFGFAAVESADLQTFIDANQIEPDYREAFQQAVALGLVKGYQEQLHPNDPITRAEAAVMSNRFYKQILYMQETGGSDEANR
jgi:hypothetical protein